MQQSIEAQHRQTVLSFIIISRRRRCPRLGAQQTPKNGKGGCRTQAPTELTKGDACVSWSDALYLTVETPAAPKSPPNHPGRAGASS